MYQPRLKFETWLIFFEFRLWQSLHCTKTILTFYIRERGGFIKYLLKFKSQLIVNKTFHDTFSIDVFNGLLIAGFPFSTKESKLIALRHPVRHKQIFLKKHNYKIVPAQNNKSAYLKKNQLGIF